MSRKCASQATYFVPHFSSYVSADVATKAEEALFYTELQLSINDGPFFPVKSSVEIKPERSKVCARAAAIHLKTKEESFSDTWCGSTEELDLEPRTNCEEILDVYKSCGFDVSTGKSSGGPQPYLESLEGDPVAIYQEVCQKKPPVDPPPVDPPPVDPPPGAGAVPEGAAAPADAQGCGCATPGMGARGVALWSGAAILLGGALLRGRRRRAAGGEQHARGHAEPW
jgi:hypothetical protein